MGILLAPIFVLLKLLQLIGDSTIWFIKTVVSGILLFGVFTTSSIKAIGRGIKQIVALPFQKQFSFSPPTISLPKIAIPKVSFSLPKRPKKKQKAVTVPPIHKPVIRHEQPLPTDRVFGIPRSIRYFSYGFLLAALLFFVIFGIYSLSTSVPNAEMLTLRDVPVTTKIFDRNGVLLYEIYADENRTPVELAQLPEDFVNATIAMEDRNYYKHQGFSPRGIVRAAYKTVVDEELQGGSTITQQLVRSALLSLDVTMERKIKELIVSVWAEQIYSKDEILEMYFNQVPYGGTAWGAEAAAQTYFGKSIKEVTLPEAALIAGLPAAPTRFSPHGAHPELSLVRQQQVLQRMVEDGYITEEERQRAIETPVIIKQPNIGIKSPHFVMYVKDVLTEKYGERMVEQGGLQVHTSLDLELQKELENVVQEEVDKLAHLNVGNGAVVVTDTKTGQILAMVGSTDYFNLEKDGNVNVAVTQQQPGSTIKVVTYTAALDNGFTAATLINDSPITYSGAGGPAYSPVNYDGSFHGYVPLRAALANSYNIPAVKTLAKIGVPTLVEKGQDMGIDSWNDPSRFGLSLTLGGGEVTMLDMAEVYGTLANKGVHREATPIIRVTDHMGNEIENSNHEFGEQVISPEVAFIMSDMLSDNKARSAAFGPNSLLHIPDQWTAVKTGTSNDKRDNWAIGYTDTFVVTAWVGNNNNSPMHPTLTSGITGATPIWRRTTDILLKRKPSEKPPVPSGITTISCRGNTEYFVAGTQPRNGCPPIPTPKPTGEPTPSPEPERG